MLSGLRLYNSSTLHGVYTHPPTRPWATRPSSVVIYFTTLYFPQFPLSIFFNTLAGSSFPYSNILNTFFIYINVTPPAWVIAHSTHRLDLSSSSFLWPQSSPPPPRDHRLRKMARKFFVGGNWKCVSHISFCTFFFNFSLIVARRWSACFLIDRTIPIWLWVSDPCFDWLYLGERCLLWWYCCEFWIKRRTELLRRWRRLSTLLTKLKFLRKTSLVCAASPFTWIWNKKRLCMHGWSSLSSSWVLFVYICFGFMWLVIKVLENFTNAEVVVSPPYVFLPMVKSILRPDFYVAAQNCWVKKGGAFTGEVRWERFL